MKLTRLFEHSCPMGIQQGASRSWTNHPAKRTEFYFPFKGQRLYGKILLRTDKQRIVIFSAHRPLKPKLNCE